MDLSVSSRRQVWQHHRFLSVINTDKALTYGIAIAQLKDEGKCPGGLVHRQVKYLTNVVETDNNKLKQLIKPVRGFKMLKTAYATTRMRT